MFLCLQTFHTPSFGDEEFDIPPINPHHQQAGNQHPSQANMASYQQSQMMGNQPTDAMVMNDPSAYQQPLYLTGPPEHSMGMSVRYGSVHQFIYIHTHACMYFWREIYNIVR